MTRTLIYGLPSSGGSYVTWCLGSDPQTVVIPDTYASHAPDAKHFDGLDVILKVCVSKRGSLSESIEAFRPDKTILVLRDEQAVGQSLIRRAAKARRPEVFLKRGPRDVFRLCAIMRRAIAARELWDEAVCFDDFDKGRVLPARELAEIVAYNYVACPWCRDNHHPQKWGIGGIRPAGMSRDELKTFAWGVRCGAELPGERLAVDQRADELAESQYRG